MGFQALLIVAAILLYALAFWHGKHGGFSRHCHCPEPSDPLISIFERADPKVVASCVLHDRPTRGVLHSRLARCLGRSRWRLAERPEQISTAATSWSDGEKELQSSLGNEEVPPFQGVEGEASTQASEEALPLAGSEGIETPSHGFAHPSGSEERNPVAAEPSFGQGVDSPASEVPAAVRSTLSVCCGVCTGYPHFLMCTGQQVGRRPAAHAGERNLDGKCDRQGRVHGGWRAC